MTAVLLLAWLTALAAVALLAAVHAWYPARFLDLAVCMAGWCTTLTAIAVTLDLARHP